MFSKEELVRATGAVVIRDSVNSDETYTVSTDTRTINNTDIYLPLKGENFDGEAFIPNAVKVGAKAYFTTKGILVDGAELVLKVDDTKDAYLKIAQYYRKKINPKTVAVTGSSGKTTTKELIYSVLSKSFMTHKTYSNHNNEIGFCQTVLSMPKNTDALIVEAGMRGLGEIELISTRLEPDYAVITNSGSAHVGRLGSLDNIAAAKCEIAKGLKSDGVFIAKNQDIIKRHINFDGRKIYYSLEDVKFIEKSPSYTKFEYKNKTYELNVEGDYNVENSLAAIELGYLFGMSYDRIKEGLAIYKPIEKRWEITNVGKFNFINDSYNANPESMKASVKTFVELYKNAVVVLGNMGELGEDEAKYHYQVGEYLASFSNPNVKYLLVGNLAAEIGKALEKFGYKPEYFENNDDVSLYILENINADSTIFLKASRSMKFEEILENIKRGID